MSRLFTNKARHTNVDTSHEAARSFADSGKRRILHQKILDFLEDHPNSTARRVAEGINKELPSTTTRFNELMMEGEVVMKPEKKRNKGGASARTWRLTTNDERRYLRKLCRNRFPSADTILELLLEKVDGDIIELTRADLTLLRDYKAKQFYERLKNIGIERAMRERDYDDLQDWS